MLDCVHGLPQEPVNSLKIRVWLIHLSLAPDMVLVPDILNVQSILLSCGTWNSENVSPLPSADHPDPTVLSQRSQSTSLPQDHRLRIWRTLLRGPGLTGGGPDQLYTLPPLLLSSPQSQRKHQHLSKIK